MLDLVRLVALRELALRGTIAAAADALGYTASAVSQQLATLEREAGVPLTIRSGRRVILTPAGERLVARTHELLDTMELAEAELSAGSGRVTGTVRLAVFQSAALTIVTGALLRLRESHPGIRVKVTQTEPEEAFADTWAREYDLVVAEEYPHHSAPHYPGVVRRPLVRDELLLAVGGEWAGASSVAELADAAWVMEPAGTATRHFAEQTCRVAGFEPDVRFESSDLQAHVQLVQKGLAVAILPGLMVSYAGIDARVLPLAGGPRRTVFTAMRATSRRDPAVEAVRAALEASAT
ncbi:LysR family transcriptional regulator [Demequina sp. SYSU T00192]|uniref:LysR family transcriptional regulator n=1 Tax=Demequina litoralis TaxID=3051660 RepID=A0ABT8G5T5_9MICO|nr:LysR family transcriptional regulator [Demequina sp. SYSU T00192]MDN4474417.1 LysR family transcriptional regulator [Demequina sp. SYSU T00192]